LRVILKSLGLVVGGCALVVACSSSGADDPGNGASSGLPGDGGTSGTSGASGTSGTSGTSGGIGDAAADSPTAGETTCDPAKTDCKAGEVCTGVGRPAPVCRAGCASEAECAPPKTSCVLLSAGSGACAATCTPFGADCPAGFTCTAHAPEAAGVAQTSKSAFCRKTGATALGAACVDDPTSCGAEAECLFFPGKGEGVADSRCHSLCDAAHACGAGKGNCIIKPGETFGFCDG
jgi:hypothetical protein